MLSFAVLSLAVGVKLHIGGVGNSSERFGREVVKNILQQLRIVLNASENSCKFKKNIVFLQLPIKHKFIKMSAYLTENFLN